MTGRGRIVWGAAAAAALRAREAWAGAEEELNAAWGGAAAGAAPAGAPHWGQSLLALAVVVGLLLLLAWGLKRLRARTRGGEPAAAEPRLLMRARFNAAQTLVLWERDGEVECLILRGREVEFQARVPEAARRGADAAAAGQTRGGQSFGEIWQTLLGGPGPRTGGAPKGAAPRRRGA